MTFYNNKLGKHKALLSDAELARYLPPTGLATKARIRGMLGKYKAVYLKPSNGSGGFGIYKLSRRNNGYRLQNGTLSRMFGSYDGAFAVFAKETRRRVYLVQKSIPLLRFKGRPFDLRVMVQKNLQRKWEVTGIVGRLARPHKIVTNFHNGGKPMLASELLAPHIPKSKQAHYIRRIEKLGIQISSQMKVFFPQFRAYGIDIGIDTNRKPWIIEVNTKPDKYIFNALKDKRMFRKIMRYARMANKRK